MTQSAFVLHLPKIKLLIAVVVATHQGKRGLIKVGALLRKGNWNPVQGGTMPWVLCGQERASLLCWASILADQEEMMYLKEIRRSNDVVLF